MSDDVHKKIQELEEELEGLRKRIYKATWYTHSSYNHYEYLEVMGLEEEDVGPDVDFKYALYEVAFDVEVDLQTGEYKILEVRDGNQVLVPKDSP